MTTANTKQRILSAAEGVFADQGFAGASLRAITQEAEVNLAAVNYHFGSKAGLYRAIFEQRIEPINRERLERLDQLEAAGTPSVDQLVHALVAPAIVGAHSWGPEGELFLRISGRMFSEPGEHWQGIDELFREVKQRFVRAFNTALPELAPQDLFWNMYLLLGCMCHAMSAGSLLAVLSLGACSDDDPEEVVAHLVPFLAAGMRSRAANPATGAEQASAATPSKGEAPR